MLKSVEVSLLEYKLYGYIGFQGLLSISVQLGTAVGATGFTVRPFVHKWCIAAGTAFCIRHRDILQIEVSVVVFVDHVCYRDQFKAHELSSRRALN